MRQVLAEQPNFTPFTAFKALAMGGVNFKQLSAFLTKNNVVHNKFEVAWLVKSIDLDLDGVVGYKDFLQFVGYKHRPGGMQSEVWEKLQKAEMGVDVEYALARLFERELDMHRKIENQKSDIINSEISIQESYFYIFSEKWLKDGFTFKSLKSFLVKQCEFEVLDEEVKAIFRRIDRDQDGIVSCRDYANSMMPLHSDKREQVNWMNCKLKCIKEHSVSKLNLTD